jgi:hypothetical protein
LDAISKAIKPNGCFIVASFGLNGDDTSFLTDLNAKEPSLKNVKYDGGYIFPLEFQSLMEKTGFFEFEIFEGETTWDTVSFAKPKNPKNLAE